MNAIKGNTWNCLRHFLEYLSGAKEEEQAKYSGFFSFIGTNNGSLLREWMEQKKKPSGLQLLKIIVYLNNLGYRIEDMEGLPKSFHQAVEILAMETISPIKAAEEIGYEKTSDLYSVLIGRRGFSGKAKIRIDQFAKNYHRPSEFIKGKVVATKNPGDDFAQNPINEDLIMGIIQTLGYSADIIAPVLEKMLTGTPESRQNFREKLSGKGQEIFKISNSFYRLSTILNALCTEKSLEKYKTKKNKQ